ncbi:MAG: hypothetical protein AAFN06_18970, partial [Pseudomonadota bacterium]
MDQDYPSKDMREEDKRELKLAKSHMTDVLEALSKRRDELKECIDPDEVKDAVKLISLLRSAIDTVQRERERIERLCNDLPSDGDGDGTDFDFDTARDKIRSQLAG